MLRAAQTAHSWTSRPATSRRTCSAGFWGRWDVLTSQSTTTSTPKMWLVPKIGHTTPGRQQITVDASAAGFSTAQVLALGQEVAFEYQGVQFVLRVSNLMVLDRKHTQMGVPRGLLVRDTSFTYEAQNHTNIKVRPPPPG
jgi:hypothetical protein